MLIAGGSMLVIGFSMIIYYGVQLVNRIQQDEKLKVDPGSSLQVKQNITSSQGAYVVIFPDFEGKPTVSIKDPSGHLVNERTIEPPIVLQPFEVVQPGVYTLIISNPTDRVLEPFIVLGDQENVLVSATESVLAFTLLIAIGAAVAVAGAVITVLDKRRITKMKQFGDTTDLV